MGVMLATLCLNEAHWLPFLYEQHKSWPGVKWWTFVEAADRAFAAANPGAVTADGLSTDGTTELLGDLARRDPRVRVIHHGWCGGEGVPLDQGKVPARQRYLDVAAQLKPDFVFVLDADEFYLRPEQYFVTRSLRSGRASNYAWVFRQRHLWFPPAYFAAPERRLFVDPEEAVGGYWAVPHTRGWRWEPGLHYRDNHNWPQDSNGRFLHVKSPPRREDGVPGSPTCVHLGFASPPASRMAKNRYYVNRGEGAEEGRRIRRTRSMYVDCRSAYESWHPGDPLPHGARVVPYDGPIPEVFAGGLDPARLFLRPLPETP